MSQRVVLSVLVVALLSGCGRTVVQETEGSQPPLPPFAGPVCLLPKNLPADTRFTLLGRAVSNTGTYGGFAKVNLALANVARSVGADVVIDKRSKMKFAPIPWAALRPQSWGMAVRLKDPQAFDCIASGGRLYDYSGPIEVAPPRVAPAGDKGDNSYDACMARVIKISDPQLRTTSMSMCDSVE